MRIYRFRGAEIDVLLVPVANSRDDYGRPSGGVRMADVQRIAHERGFRLKRELTPSEWKRVQALRSAGAEHLPIPEDTLK